jgi:hydroxyethylthiazole kinase-like uncharacterized protein yjeF
MTAILTAAEMRALEQAAIAKGEVTGLELMERAGRGVVEAILEEWPEVEDGARRAVVLCGPGNNGGDGFVVARLLKERGWEVEVFLYGDAEKLPPDARANYERWLKLGSVGDCADFDAPAADLDIFVDAIFGIGLNRPVEGEAEKAIDKASWAAGRAAIGSVAIDLPSGLCSDSGRSLGQPVSVSLTVTFAFLKVGHVLAEAEERCGKVVVADIGLDARAPWKLFAPYDPLKRPSRDTSRILRLLDDDSLHPGFSSSHSILDKRYGTRTGHKYSHGHALILSGRPGRGGAARMTARGALRIGAGLVTLAVPPGALQENAARLDAIMLRSVRDAEALTGLLSDARLNALAAGPGLGTSDREAALLSALLDASRGAAEQKPRSLVLDADALTLLSKDEALRAKLHDKCVLTPHDGEFARLFPAIAEKWHEAPLRGPAYSKVDAARDAARECGATVLLKGPDTVIASPDGRAAINAAVYDRAAPWLATAGSGDVLAGFIAGLLARGFQPFEAACTAAWLHVECARSFGPGLIAEDLPEELPKVFRTLGL